MGRVFVGRRSTWSCSDRRRVAAAASHRDEPTRRCRAGGEDASVPSAQQVDTKHGRVTGKQVGSTREFLGIPYGKAQRFLPPMAADDWSEARDATQFGPACPQAKNSLASVPLQSEDCLTVNVYTPADVSGPLPVIVFLHGGAFVMGASSQYDSQMLSELGVVVVTLNYRLGALGFLSLPALDDIRAGAPSGSDGIRDQQLALHWVHDDIAAFGGDATNVTLVGESAGDQRVHSHAVAEQSRLGGALHFGERHVPRRRARSRLQARCERARPTVGRWPVLRAVGRAGVPARQDRRRDRQLGPRTRRVRRQLVADDRRAGRRVAGHARSVVRFGRFARAADHRHQRERVGSDYRSGQSAQGSDRCQSSLLRPSDAIFQSAPLSKTRTTR